MNAYQGEDRKSLNRLVVRVPSDMLLEIDRAAAADRTVTRAAVVRNALQDWLTRRQCTGGQDPGMDSRLEQIA